MCKIIDRLTHAKDKAQIWQTENAEKPQSQVNGERTHSINTLEL